MLRTPLAAAALAALTVCAPLGAGAAVPGPLPGPAILYAPPAPAPQFINDGIWHAPPILISGASAYRMGEYLYQDFLYDDNGAKAIPDRSGVTGSPDYINGPAGTYTYPRNANYGNNAADLVEFRMKLTSSGTAFRVTFNTMHDPSLVAFTIGLGSSVVAYPMPHGANAKEQAAAFVTVHGTSIDVIDAATGALIASNAQRTAKAPAVSVNVTSRQFDLRVPFGAYDTRTPALRVSIASGLWDTAHGTYLIPQVLSDAVHPGGAGGLVNPPAFFNVGFRHAEPLTTGWRDASQASALAASGADLSAFADIVDTTKLAARLSDDMPALPQGVPQTGVIDRILASHFEPAQGMHLSPCNGFLAICAPEYTGNLQPYAIYVPKKAPPASGYGFTLLLHALTGNYNQLSGSHWQAQLGERATGSLVVTPEGRGPDTWYFGLAGAEVFEIWSDVASHYRLDPAFSAMDGYSMGGYGTYKLATAFPDLFARIHTTVGTVAAQTDWVGQPPITGTMTLQTRMMPSLRNVPVLMWYAGQDELVPAPGSLQLQKAIDALGYRYEYDLFSPAEHLTLTSNDGFQPDADFLGNARVDLNPPHVTYARNPAWDTPQFGVVGDHAYWLANIQVRNTALPQPDAPLGVVDVRSHGFGVADPLVGPTTPVAGVLTGGYAPLAYTGFARTWGAAPPAPVQNTLDITATNIGSVTIAPSRARVNCQAALNVTSDGPISITLAGCGTARQFSAGRSTLHITR